MPIFYEKFELPEKIKMDEKTATSNFSRFIAEPFERGFGHTIGNAMRRMLLTSIEAPAIISFFMEKVPHEYMAVEGIIEDVTTIILNLKGALIRLLPQAQAGHKIKYINKIIDIKPEDLSEKGQKVITLGDIISGSEFEVVNPSLPIFTVTQPMTRRIELKLSIGRGYVPSERHLMDEKAVDEIIMDSAFSPVRLVNYFVEDTRVGQDTDFDRLILDVTTDGRITPKEAVAHAAKILSKHLGVFEKMDEDELVFKQESALGDGNKDELMQKLVLGINEIELSVRSTNCLNGARIETIGELVVVPEPQLLQFRNFGKKSLSEIKVKLSEMGLSLGMDLSHFDITQDNVKDKIREYLEEHRKVQP
ncbi:MAG: DNA-directed RNA polymerase subunit alpha [Chlamydiales bacterium]